MMSAAAIDEVDDEDAPPAGAEVVDLDTERKGKRAPTPRAKAASPKPRQAGQRTGQRRPRRSMNYRIAPIFCRPWTLNNISPRLIESHYEHN
jgi:hypothetical protein